MVLEAPGAPLDLSHCLEVMPLTVIVLMFVLILVLVFVVTWKSSS